MAIVVAGPAQPYTPVAGMTFLQLCQRLRRKCRVVGNGPTAVTNQTEEYARLIDFINEAWLSIQEAREDWMWMRTSCSFTTTTLQAVYTPAQIGISDFGNWTRDTWRCYPTAAGDKAEILMDYIDYELWRDTYQFGATRYTQTQPVQITITPQKYIGLGPTPLQGYTITGDYYRVPSELVNATDVPSLPERFQMLIVYKAMMYYGAGEAAPEVYQEGKIEFDRMMTRLQLNQLPEIYGAPALA